MARDDSENARILIADAYHEDREKLRFLLNIGGY
jgi:hypothetical protein